MKRLTTVCLKGTAHEYFFLQCPSLSAINSIFSSFCPCAIFLVPGLGLVRAQEAPQQIITGFSCGPDIKGARGEEGNSRGAETQDSKHWHRYVRGESRTWNQAERLVLSCRGWRATVSGGSWDWETVKLVSVKCKGNKERKRINRDTVFRSDQGWLVFVELRYISYFTLCTI